MMVSRNSYFEGLLESLWFGPEMILFPLLFVGWWVVFVFHLRRPESRLATSRGLFSISVALGILSPLHYFLRLGMVGRFLRLGGVPDPLQWFELQYSAIQGSVVIACMAMALLAGSTWAGMLPRRDLKRELTGLAD
ncbi:MAG: hypothetical protein ACQKBU_07270 [Verrucomicrobiales bacterium]